MTETQVRLGYFESICQVLALETEDLTVEHPGIWKLIQTRQPSIDWLLISF